jgi:hypothetical protein
MAVNPTCKRESEAVGLAMPDRKAVDRELAGVDDRARRKRDEPQRDRPSRHPHNPASIRTTTSMVPGPPCTVISSALCRWRPAARPARKTAKSHQACRTTMTRTTSCAGTSCLSRILASRRPERPKMAVSHHGAVAGRGRSTSANAGRGAAFSRWTEPICRRIARRPPRPRTANGPWMTHFFRPRERWEAKPASLLFQVLREAPTVRAIGLGHKPGRRPSTWARP